MVDIFGRKDPTQACGEASKSPTSAGDLVIRSKKGEAGSLIGGGVELLLDGEPLRGVTNFSLFVDADNMLPVVCLLMVPHTVDVQLSEVDLRKALSAKHGLMYDLANQWIPPSPIKSALGSAPAPALSIEEMQKAYDANFPGVRETATKTPSE